MAKVIKEADFKHKITDSLKRTTLNFTDILNNNNKFYQIEVVKASDNNFYLFTNYGRVGGTAAKEYRSCSDQHQAEAEAEKIIKSKTKKGYVEIKLLKADIGSEVAKTKVGVSVISEDSARNWASRLKKMSSPLYIQLFNY